VAGRAVPHQISNSGATPRGLAPDAQQRRRVTDPSGSARRVVLVVEDDPQVGDLLAGAINDERGYVALHVASGSDALRALDTVDADLVLLDVGLPGMSGIEVYDRMRRDERLRDVPVMFETAAAAEQVTELRERGVAAFIRKPFDLDDVLGYVKRIVPPRREPTASTR